MAPKIRLLVVCTANVARSPLLAVRLQADIDRTLGYGVASVTSAGTNASYGQPAATGSQKVADRWGLSLVTHQSRSLAYVDPSGIDLVLMMANRHRRAVTRSLPVPAERTFRVRLLAALADSVAAETVSRQPGEPSQQIDKLVTTLAGLRPPKGIGRRLDIPDPIQQPQAVFDALGEEFADASERICRLLGGSPPARS